MFSTLRGKIIWNSLSFLLLIWIAIFAGYLGTTQTASDYSKKLAIDEHTSFDTAAHAEKTFALDFALESRKLQADAASSGIFLDVVQILDSVKRGDSSADNDLFKDMLFKDISRRLQVLGYPGSAAEPTAANTSSVLSDTGSAAPINSGNAVAALGATSLGAASLGAASGKKPGNPEQLDADIASYAQLAQKIAATATLDPSSASSMLAPFRQSFNHLQADIQIVSAHPVRTQAHSFVSPSEEVPSWFLSTLFTLWASSIILWGLFIRSTHRHITLPLTHFRRITARVQQGDVESRVKNTTPDEIGEISRAYDQAIDDHLLIIRKTASDNERINNSVIGLFQAMGALSEKDLTVRAPVTDDIIGTLGDAINQLTDVTSSVLHHVTQIAGVVEDASERMKKQSDVVNEMAREEDVIVARLISNLETAMASIGDVALVAGDSNIAAAEATESTESAMHTVQATLSGMGIIRETISEMEKRIKRLGERSQEISQIVNLINTISERTHVLSLNAAMQAAMAGDAGRGFAVVAEEVQRLAENSRQATGQIANLVQNIQVETNDTISTVNTTIEQVIKESALAQDAWERMKETHESTARLVRLVASISTSSSEQTRIAEVLRAAADDIAQFTQKTAEQLNNQNQSAASLVSASQKLVGAISVFKLPPVDRSDLHAANLHAANLHAASGDHSTIHTE